MAVRRLLFVACTVACMAGSVSAATWNVPAETPSIAAALDSAAYGDTVLVAPGTYLEHSLVVPSGVVLSGSPEDPAAVVIDAGQQGYVMMIPQADATSVVEGLTLTGGSFGMGGGLYCGYPTRATIRHCVIENNVAANGGGGLACAGADPVFEFCRFTGNTSRDDGVDGGGGVHLNGSNPVFRHCEFAGNTTPGKGGGVSAYASAPRFENCSFTGNTADGASGIFVYHAEATLVDCKVTDNTVSGYGVGAVSAYEAQVTLENCTISGQSSSSGSAVYGNSNSSIVMRHCSITGNSAFFVGGGVSIGIGSTLGAEYCHFEDNTDMNGANDGDVGRDCSAVLTCCTTDASLWSGDGSITFDDEDCTVPTVTSSWGDLKALYR